MNLTNEKVFRKVEALHQDGSWLAIKFSELSCGVTFRIYEQDSGLAQTWVALSAPRQLVNGNIEIDAIEQHRADAIVGPR
jgi:hypothetical protein